ncbi:hypothetical protein C1H76_8084 [Elsinoe australis]|uniref:Uncharacterized protein n=1 Tax=Elsinoe australis TaxID=40998 RepID=A0A4U7ATT3_9PEZI|nr:hypothetical protein C1H76_8084 [Elsinoe australis]
MAAEKTDAPALLLMVNVDDVVVFAIAVTTLALGKEVPTDVVELMTVAVDTVGLVVSVLVLTCTDVGVGAAFIITELVAPIKSGAVVVIAAPPFVTVEVMIVIVFAEVVEMVMIETPATPTGAGSGAATGNVVMGNAVTVVVRYPVGCATVAD